MYSILQVNLVEMNAVSSEEYQLGLAAKQQASEDNQTVSVSDGSSIELEEKSTSKVLI